MTLLQEVNAGGGASRPTFTTKNEQALAEETRLLQSTDPKLQAFYASLAQRSKIFLKYAGQEKHDIHQFNYYCDLLSLYEQESLFCNKKTNKENREKYITLSKQLIDELRASENIQKSLAVITNTHTTLSQAPMTAQEQQAQVKYVQKHADTYVQAQRNLKVLNKRAGI